ncbi:IS110 family transposase, partial [Pseudomonas dryadis]
MCIRRAGRTTPIQEFRQTPEGRLALIKKLGQQVACVVLEATGIYYLDLAVALHRAGLPVAVINP